ncbi:MAG: hypothetical protein LBU76_01835 [Azoarcus sp.]|jgi:alpha-galactosidase|nr:hypothetical protein [Azoarcus sp.]
MKNNANHYIQRQKKYYIFTRIITCILVSFIVSTSYADDSNISAVFIGNSITRHGPAPAIGWTGNWGMAASVAEKDYVWQVTQKLLVKSSQSFNISPLESVPEGMHLQNSMLITARQSQLLVIQLGDNVKKENISNFNSAYIKLLSNTKPIQGLLICLSTWYRNSTIDAIIEQACDYAGGRYIQIGDIHRNPDFTAVNQGFSHSGVGSHPSDAGMAEIAKRISVTFKEYNSGLGNHSSRQP